ncbi:hypothetical protein BSLG_004320 [Batrachochytrium salamandrivorans]|nr:hypothetical protein BSLG_004320 [Batrachochytrium salamandrivorans]
MSSESQQPEEESQLSYTQVPIKPASLAEQLTGVPTTTLMLALFSSCMIMLTSGTAYLFSLYGPQLSAELNLTQSEIAFIAICGNIGIFISGPLMGALADKYRSRPQLLVLAGGFTIGAGYILVASIYYGRIAQPHFIVVALIFLFIGFGSAACYHSALATNYRIWPAQHRGFVIGVNVAFFGLSAFAFANMAGLFPMVDKNKSATGLDVAAYLEAVGLICILLNIFGAATMVSPINVESRLIMPGSPSYTPRFYSARDINSSPNQSTLSLQQGEHPSSETTPLMHGYTRFDSCDHRYVTLVSESFPTLEIEDISCFSFSDAYILAAIMLILIGVCLMYYNNVGAVILSLSPNDQDSSHPDVHLAQRINVTLLALLSFCSRIVIGIAADHSFRKLAVPHAVWLLSAVLMATVASVVLTLSTTLQQVLAGSILFGISFGTTWTIMPVLVGEYFGFKNFGRNWGWMTVMPAFGGPALSALFGSVYDHALKNGSGVELPSGIICKGRECFSFSFGVGACLLFVSFVLHLISTWRFATLSQRIMSFVVMLSFLAIRTLYIPVLFLFAPLSSVPQFALDSLKASIICITVVFLYTLLLPTLAGLYGAFQFESWSSSTNSEMGQDKLKHMLSSGKLAQMVVMVHINKENISAIVRTIKSLVRSTYDPRYLVVHLCFNPAVLPKSYQQVIQFLHGKTHDPLPPQGYPLRYTIEYENVQFVLHRGKQHDQGAVFCEIQQNFQGVNHRTYLLSFAADTILYEDCIVEMVYAMESRNDSIGVTGFVTGTCPSRGSVFRHFQEAEFVTEETIDRSLEMAFGNKASVPCALQLVLHVLTQQHKSNMLKFCPNARAKTEAATSWATMFQQESRWHMPLAANKVLRMSGMSMRLFAHLSIIQVIFETVSMYQYTSSLDVAPIYMDYAPGILSSPAPLFAIFMFPLTFIVNPWMRLATNVANILYLQTDTIPTKERVIQVKDIEVGYNVPKLDSSKPMEATLTHPLPHLIHLNPNRVMVPDFQARA